jgi:hypothetical protein
MLGRGEDKSITLTPMLSEAAKAEPEPLNGLSLTLPVEKDMLILIGPGKNPPEKSVGALLRDEDVALGDGRLLVLEARTAR